MVISQNVRNNFISSGTPLIRPPLDGESVVVRMGWSD